MSRPGSHLVTLETRHFQFQLGKSKVEGCTIGMKINGFTCQPGCPVRFASGFSVEILHNLLHSMKGVVWDCSRSMPARLQKDQDFGRSIILPDFDLDLSLFAAYKVKPSPLDVSDQKRNLSRQHLFIGTLLKESTSIEMAKVSNADDNLRFSKLGSPTNFESNLVSNLQTILTTCTIFMTLLLLFAAYDQAMPDTKAMFTSRSGEDHRTVTRNTSSLHGATRPNCLLTTTNITARWATDRYIYECPIKSQPHLDKNHLKRPFSRSCITRGCISTG